MSLLVLYLKGLIHYYISLNLIVNYEYNTKNATISANRPVASAKAKPRIAYENNCEPTLGFLAVPEIKAEKIKPIPAPAPIKPEHARPAPMYLAAANIIFRFVMSASETNSI